MPGCAAPGLIEEKLAEVDALPTGPSGAGPEYARADHLEAQALRHRSQGLMRAFLDPEVFDGRVRIEPERLGRRSRQESMSHPSSRPAGAK
jgi:hypothetical protein